MTSGDASFGKQVKLLRAAAGLTQEDLAEKAGVSVRTVSDLERGLRASVYPATARRLAASLDVGPEQLPQFLLRASGADVAPGAVTDALAPFNDRGRIPVPLTRLIGRESEVAELRRLLTDGGQRLVTLVGPGGIGKTRLAIDVALLVHDEFDGGAFFVSLSATDDPHMVLPLIASAVGVATGSDVRHAVLQRLDAARTLLLLDTFETVLPAAPEVGNLLAATSQLTVLATSRAPLHVRGEREVPMHPLAVQRAGGPGATDTPAAELFIERATAVVSEFGALDARGTVAEICARLDGLPLAIELAAARLRHMTLPDLRTQLQHRLDPLVDGHRDLPPRQRTMRAALDWSYARLGPDAMRLFRTVAVFRDGFSQTAAVAVAGSEGEAGRNGIIAALSALVDSSLVAAGVVGEGETRYHLLDVTREYARERAIAAGELEEVRRRHATYFLDFAERAEPQLRGAEQRQWHGRLLADEANFRAALTWALESGEGGVALRLAAALWMFWRWAGLFAEGREWLDAALAAGHDAPVDLRCRGLWAAGWLAFHAGDYAATEQHGNALLQLIGPRDHAIQRRDGVTLVGHAALARGDNEEAVVALAEAVTLCAPLGASWHLAASELNLGTALLQSGAADEAHGHLERALTGFEQLGDDHFRARVLVQLGYAALVVEHRAEAANHIQRAIETFASLGDGWAIAEGLEAAATLRSEPDPRLAAILGGAAEQLRDRIAMQPHPPDARLTQVFLDRARTRLSAEEFRDAWNRGRALSPEAVVAMLLDLTHGTVR